MADVVGIAVHGRTMRAVETRIRRNGRCTAVRAATVELPEGAVENGRIIDELFLVEAIEALWERGGFKTKRARFGIDGRIAVVRRTELPAKNEATLRNAARYDISELLNYPISEAVFDVDQIEPYERHGEAWAKALVVAVQESALFELQAIARSAGLRLAGTDLVAEALVRSVEHDRAEPVAIVDCEDSLTNVVIRDETGVLFARTLNSGVGASSASVADELESALAQLGGEVAVPSSSPTAAIGVSTVVEGVRRTMNYFASELDHRPIAAIAIAGGRASAAGLVDALEASAGVPCVPSALTGDWEVDGAPDGYELAFGVAMGSGRSSHRHLELRSDHERDEREHRLQRTASIGVTVPLVAALAWSTIGLRADVADQQVLVDEAAAQADELALRLDDFDDTQVLLENWASVSSDIDSLDAQRLRLPVVIEELAEAMPMDTRLVSVQIRRLGDDATPTGYVGPTPFGLISITAIANDLDGVGRWIEAVNETETIEGVWLDQSSYGPIGTAEELGAIFTVEGAVTGAARPLEATDRAEATE